MGGMGNTGGTLYYFSYFTTILTTRFYYIEILLIFFYKKPIRIVFFIIELWTAEQVLQRKPHRAEGYGLEHRGNEFVNSFIIHTQPC